MLPDPTDHPAIEVAGVTHHYGFRPVLRDVTLRIERGELVALMGANGMGKSTLMAIMAGILSPSRGYVAINGQRQRASEETEIAIRRQVVYVPAESWMPRTLSGRAWLLAIGHIYEHDDLDLMEHADRLMELFDLSDKQESAISSYSTGQIKKLALAGALITKAPIMLLDEPFGGGLDPAGIMALKRVMQRLRDDRQVTIVMATPVPDLVEDLADRIAVVRDGSLVAFDTIPGLRQASGVEGSWMRSTNDFSARRRRAMCSSIFRRGGHEARAI
jgi:ABC-type multidrug transport system ATPase subunit